MNPFQTAISAIGDTTATLDLTSVAKATELIAEAGRIVLSAVGRERMQLAAFAMRLHQLGLRVAMHGDMAEPPLGQGDLFICSAGFVDHTTTSALAGAAAEAGAAVLLMTADRDSLLRPVATCHVRLSPPDPHSDRQGHEPRAALAAGAVYEGALFVLFEVMALDLRQKLAVIPETMAARQGNLD